MNTKGYQFLANRCWDIGTFYCCVARSIFGISKKFDPRTLNVWFCFSRHPGTIPKLSFFSVGLAYINVLEVFSHAEPEFR